MPTSEGEAIRIARDMTREHGSGAVFVAVEQLNAMIDCDDWRGRDLWARVVHAIHELQGLASTASEGTSDQPLPQVPVSRF